MTKLKGYLVMKIQKWEDTELESVGAYKLPIPTQFVGNEKEIGFCRVFRYYEDALEYAGDSMLIYAIQEAKTE